MSRASARLIAVLIVLTVWTAAANASEFWEVVFDKHVEGGSALYDIYGVGANKSGATTCELTTPAGTFACVDVGGWFAPEQSFLAVHTDMFIAGLQAAIAGGWTLTFDDGLPTETVATISFGTVLAQDFPLVPIIMAPLNGWPVEIPWDPNPPAITWTYNFPACVAQLDVATVNLFGPSGAEIEAGDLVCNVLSWTPPTPLTVGTWLTRVSNEYHSFRFVPDGIVITGDAWILENSDWLSLRGIDTSTNEVVPTAIDYSDYVPLNVGATWSYDEFNPAGASTDTVYPFPDISGQPAVRLATDGIQLLCWNDGISFTLYGYIDGSDTTYFNPYPNLGSLDDGTTFDINCADTLCSTNLIRVWEFLDPVAASVYGIDPGYRDLVVWATYDDDEAPNSQNAIIESNLPAGVTPPPGAVTDLDWYQLGVGLTVHIDVDAATGTLGRSRVLATATGVAEDRGVPAASLLHQNIPNPFNPSTVIRYDVAEAGHVRLRVYDVRGALVQELEDRDLEPGRHEAAWNGENQRGERVASGVYFYRLTSPGYAQTRKMVLLK